MASLRVSTKPHLCRILFLVTHPRLQEGDPTTCPEDNPRWKIPRRGDLRLSLCSLLNKNHAHWHLVPPCAVTYLWGPCQCVRPTPSLPHPGAALRRSRTPPAPLLNKAPAAETWHEHQPLCRPGPLQAAHKHTMLIIVALKHHTDGVTFSKDIHDYNDIICRVAMVSSYLSTWHLPWAAVRKGLRLTICLRSKRFGATTVLRCGVWT